MDRPAGLGRKGLGKAVSYQQSEEMAGMARLTKSIRDMRFIRGNNLVGFSVISATSEAN
jgi:hypothetical protein